MDVGGPGAGVPELEDTGAALGGHVPRLETGVAHLHTLAVSCAACPECTRTHARTHDGSVSLFDRECAFVVGK